MTLPVFFYLAKEESRRWLRIALWTTFLCSILAVPFTYSRGAVLGLAFVLTLLTIKTRKKFLLIPVIVVGIGVFIIFAPEKWASRMETIENYKQDQSAMSRLVAWRVGYSIANDRPILGGGFWVFNHPETYAKYAPKFGSFTDAHSIYFNLLGEHGYIGLVLFSLMILFLLNTLRRLEKLGKRLKQLSWVSNYADMLQVSILAYLVTGTFLSVAYFDLAYHFFVIAIILKRLASQESHALRQQPSETMMSRRPAGVILRGA
jgi:putative inorganic carbon (HCO3(-)) transporter